LRGGGGGEEEGEAGAYGEVGAAVEKYCSDAGRHGAAGGVGARLGEGVQERGSEEDAD